MTKSVILIRYSALLGVDTKHNTVGYFDHENTHQFATPTPEVTQFKEPLRVGIGGPVGSGKTALTLALCQRLA